MTTNRQSFSVSGISVHVVRKPIRNLHLAVYPPHGRVRVAAPDRLKDDAIRLAVVSRLGWIREKQREFETQERQSEREMVSGESHYYQGRRYLLDVVEEPGPPGVHLLGHKRMQLRVRPGTTRDHRDALLHAWYRRRLREQIPPLIAKWQPRMGVEPAAVHIKKMKTLWGSCNASASRIWLNLELAKKPVGCLEFILVHEMVHFLERHHNERFRGHMDSLLPSWRYLRDELNRAPLAHEDWTY